MKGNPVKTHEFKCCNNCPYFYEHVDTSVCVDSFDEPNYDWFCTNKMADNSGTDLAEYNEDGKKSLGGSMVAFDTCKIPDWCPVKEWSGDNVEIYNGDVLDSECEIIAHQINASGGFGSGVAGAIKKRYPEIAERYQKAYVDSELRLGECYVWETNDKTVKFANLCAQYNYGYDGSQYTSYDALWLSLNGLRKFCVENNIKTVAIPYGMSSVRGGAKWNIVFEMIKTVFAETEIEVKIYKL